MDSTVDAIRARARSFRNQVVAVAAVGTLSVAAAGIARSPFPLLGMLGLLPLCGLFVLADYRLLARWRVGLCHSWLRRELDFAALRSAMGAIPTLPPETLQAMLFTLPSNGTLAEEKRLAVATRNAIAATSELFYRGRCDRLLAYTLASAIFAGSMAAAVWLREWLALLGMVSVVLLPIPPMLLRQLRARRLELQLKVLRWSSDYSEADYRRFTAHLR